MPLIKLPCFDIKQIAESGQCFRLNFVCDGCYKLVAKGRILFIYETENGYDFCCSDKEFIKIWSCYFDIDTDYERYIKAIPKSDEFLSKAAQYGFGIRILHQEPFETLISFIISQRKSIPAIKTSIEALCRLCGKQIEDGIFAFPTPKALAACSIEEILSCGVGYRAPYILRAATGVVSGEVDLDSLYLLSDEELLCELLKIYGVGIKVANCTALFAYHRIAVFPEDVWIIKTVNRFYGGVFPHKLYAGFAGIIQQYMFFYARTQKINM